MAREIELKLALNQADPAAVAAIRRRASGFGGRARNVRVYNLYFDTPQCELLEARLALRLRRMGTKWLQTLKSGGSSNGGLHERDEWEYGIPDATVDLSLFAETPLARLAHPRTLHRRLKPAFITEFTRTMWQIEWRPGVKVEMALDLGVIQSQGRKEAISEVELELLEGDPEALIELARALSEAAVLRPAVASKAERGYRLFKDEPLKPHRAASLAVRAGDSLSGARQTIIGSALHHFACNVDGALSSADPGFVHQLRVALRRLRSVLSLFHEAPKQPGLKVLANTLGEVRDLDVFVSVVWPPLAEGSLAAGLSSKKLQTTERAAVNRQVQARLAVKMYLRGADTSMLMLEMLAMTLSPSGASSNVSGQSSRAAGSEETLKHFADGHIRRRHRRLFKQARHLSIMDAAARHQLRIQAKKLRYTVDSFAGLYSKERVDPYRQSLAAIQESLGALNDAATAQGLLEDLEADELLRIFAKGWFAAQEKDHLLRIEVSLEQLKAAERFWR